MATARHHINLLYITAGKTSHKVLVQNLSRLVLSQYNNHKRKTYFSQYCLHGCTSEEVLKNHLERCELHEAKRIMLPEGDDKKKSGKVKFTYREYQLHLSFVIYADFQSILCRQESCEPLSFKSFTTQYQHHVTCGSCMYV